MLIIVLFIIADRINSGIQYFTSPSNKRKRENIENSNEFLQKKKKKSKLALNPV